MLNLLSTSFVTFLSAAAAAQTYSLDGHALKVVAADGATQSVALPCEGAEFKAHQTQVFVACKTTGVVILEASGDSGLQVRALLPTQGRVVGFHESAGQLWAEVASLNAIPLDSTAMGTAMVKPSQGSLKRGAAPGFKAAPEVVTKGPVVQGTVVERRAEGVIIDLGKKDGINRGDRIALFVLNRIQLSSTESGDLEEILVVGTVRTVSQSQALVRLGLNESVPAGTLARPTKLEITASKFSPPRSGNQWSATFALRPFLTLGSSGVGTVSDASVGYRFDDPVRVQLVIEPLALGLASDGNVVGTAGNVIASYDFRYFEIGLGVGWSAINSASSLGLQREVALADGGTETVFDRVRYGLSIAQLARLGSEDGIHFLVRNTFILHEDGDQKTLNYGGTVAQLQVPIGERSAIFGRGGTGKAGFGYGELGLRHRLIGNGGPGTLFISPSVGGASVWGEIDQPDSACEGESRDYDSYRDSDGKCFKEVGYGGPLVGVTGEYRW